MPKITMPTYVDDHDGKPIKEEELVTLRLGWDSKTYQLYLSSANADKLAKEIAKWIKPDTEQVGSAPSAPKRVAAAGGTRAPRVSSDEVKSAIMSKVGSFKLADIEVSSPQTVRKVVEELVESGALKDLGADPAHTARGRAPKLYEVSGQQ